MTDKSRATTRRKRNACGLIKELAADLNITDAEFPSGADFNREQFALAANFCETHCRTPDQRERLEQARGLWAGNIVDLPAVPTLPAIGRGRSSSAAECAAPQAEVSEQVAKAPFRLRSTSCLFTWNSSEFATDTVGTWVRFLLWLESLSFVLRFTATMEQQLGL